MKLSTKGRYGLRALIDLALYSDQEAVSIQSISTRQHISDSYLEQLMRKLKERRAGLQYTGRPGRLPSGKTGRENLSRRCAAGAGRQY